MAKWGLKMVRLGRHGHDLHCVVVGDRMTMLMSEVRINQVGVQNNLPERSQYFPYVELDRRNRG